MILFPHAKINIGLDIVGRLPNGYHLIDTVMMHTDWQDILELTPAQSTELVTSGRPVNCPPEKNLVMKAYYLLADEVGGLHPTRIHLHKIIPDGAGLGGGSADAAYTLRGLNEMYNLGLSKEELATLAAKLGADCPFFIYDEPMFCTGIGTDLFPINLPQDFGNYTLAIVKPPFPVSTAEAYAGVTIEQPSKPLTERVVLPIEQWHNCVSNAFERSVIPAHPQIAEIKDILVDLGAIYSSMSGSGSAVYGIFAKTDTEELTKNIKEKCEQCDVHVCMKF